MAITSSAKKAIKASARKKIFNLRRNNAVDLAYKNIKQAIKAGKATEAKKLIPTAYKAIDKAVKTKYFKKNTASRMKSRLVKFVNKAVTKK